MPFTPYHFGAGALAKSIAPRHFSFTAFVVSNVLIDVEPLVRMLGLLDDTILHGPTHTFPGAVVIAALTLPAVRLWDRTAAALRLTGLRPPAVPTWMVLTSALIGTVSHVILDGMMHADMAGYMSQYESWPIHERPPRQVEYLCAELAWYALLIYIARLTWRLGQSMVSAWKRRRSVAERTRWNESDWPEFLRNPGKGNDSKDYPEPDLSLDIHPWGSQPRRIPSKTPQR